MDAKPTEFQKLIGQEEGGQVSNANLVRGVEARKGHKSLSWKRNVEQLLTDGKSVAAEVNRSHHDWAVKVVNRNPGTCCVGELERSEREYLSTFTFTLPPRV